MKPSRRNRPEIALPTPAELDILAVLWRLGVATVREVHDELGKDNRYTTTLKTIQLMTEKGLLTRRMLKLEPREAGNTLLVSRSPRVRKQEAQIAEGLDILRTWRHYGKNTAYLPLD